MGGLTDLEVGVSADEGDGKVGGGTCFVGVVESGKKYEYRPVSLARGGRMLSQEEVL